MSFNLSRLVLLICLCAVITQNTVLAQSPLTKDFVLTNWGTNEGLPQNSINKIVQTKDGYIWLATFGGLVRFNGTSFTVFDRSNTPEFLTDRILELYEDKSGALWMIPENTRTVLQRYYQGKFETFHLESGELTRLEFKEDEAGVLWLKAFDKFYRFKDNKFIEVPVGKNNGFFNVADTTIHPLWFTQHHSIVAIVGDSIVMVYDDIFQSNEEFYRIIEYPKGSRTFFIGTVGGGIVRLKNNSINSYTEGNGLRTNNFLSFTSDKNNNLIAMMAGFICIWNGEEFVTFSPIRESGEVQYKSFIEDNEGNYWVGTSGLGLFRLHPTVISMLDKDQGLYNEKMLSMTKLKDGTLLFGTNGDGIFEWRNGKATYSAVNKFLRNWCIWSVFQDSKGEIWIGSRGLYHSKNLTDRGREIVLDSQYLDMEIFVIFEDSKGVLWFGTGDGLFTYSDGKIVNKTISGDFYYKDVRALYEDKNGILWVGTKEGLNIIQNDVVSKITLLETKPDKGQIQQPSVRSIYQDTDGSTWIGTYGDGIFRIKNGKVSNITSKHGLFDNIVSHLVKDDNGNLWMGSNRGISRVAISDLNQFCDKKISHVRSYSYNSVNGMNSSETNGGFQPSYIFDDDGQLYLPTIGGVVKIKTSDVKPNKTPPPIQIEKIYVNHELVPLKESYIFPSDSSEFEIHFSSLSFTDPNKNQYKIKLTDGDGEWVDLGNRSVAYFYSIQPGNYEFKVIGSNNDGLWNTEGKSISITILPPFYMTAWFRSCLVLAVILFGLYIYFFQVRILRRQNHQQQIFAEQLIKSQEMERRRIASELHDGLGQQILVIKNRAELAMKNIDNPARMTEQLQEITNSAISSINDVRTITHDLRPVHLEQFGLTDTLQNMIQQVSESSQLKWVYHIDMIDGIIPKEMEINFFRIVQECINNILKHSGAAQASVMVRISDEYIQTSIWDNGSGFDIASAKNKTGLGLTGIFERTKSLGGKCQIKSEPSNGTNIIIKIPRNADSLFKQ